MGFFFRKSSKGKSKKAPKAKTVAKEATIHPLEIKDQPKPNNIKSNSIAVAPDVKQENSPRKVKVQPKIFPQVPDLQDKVQNAEKPSSSLTESEEQSPKRLTEQEDEIAENATHNSKFEKSFKELCTNEGYFTEDDILKRKTNKAISSEEKLQAHLIQFLYFKDCETNTESGKRKVYIDHYEEKLLSILSLPLSEILGIVYDFLHFMLNENHGKYVDKETKTKEILDQLCERLDLPCGTERKSEEVEKLMENRGKFISFFAAEAAKPNKLKESIETFQSAKHLIQF